jgi:hypothetical protein
MHASWLATIAAGAALAAAASVPARAFDDTQFCNAVTHLTRTANDVGTWIDRTTRNDGVEILCDRKLVHFKRYSRTPASGLQDTWTTSKTEEWQSAYCARAMWREAVENGWIISATVTTVTGARVWFACQPGGTGFHRVLP